MKSMFQAAALGLVSIVLMVGCNKEDSFKLAFSHNQHVVENGSACADCHGKMTDGRFKLPTHEACKDCHEDWLDAKKVGPKTCGMCHKIKDLRELSLDKPGKMIPEAGHVFAHTAALTNRCAECHGTLLDKKVTRIPEMTRAVKIAIREKAHKWGMDCVSCHVGMDRNTPPPNHHQNWTRRHGAMATEPDNVCGVCHHEQSCRECHQVTMPASHNNLWRLKTHGIQAEWNRSRCLVCHQQDSCDACHADTRPLSHNAGWRQNHCLNCHPSKSTGAGCTVCHQTNISTHPNPHAAGWRDQHCNSCHAGSPEQETCSVCHGWGGGLSGHPNPHPAGWQDQHCNNCHPGSPGSLQCNLCHDGVSSVANHPNIHSAGWRERHCNSCHEGPSSDQCAVCHPGGNSTQVHSGFWPIDHNRLRTTRCSYCHDQL